MLCVWAWSCPGMLKEQFCATRRIYHLLPRASSLSQGDSGRRHMYQ